ncbi:cell division protein FtsQ/DivIB [Patescibacteria group bacterium]
MHRKKPIRKKRRYVGKIIGLILFLFLIAGLAYFLFFSSFLMIKEINISVDKSVIESKALEIIHRNLDGKKIGLISQKNIILAPIEKIKANILEISPEIESVFINKKMPSLLEVNILEHQNVGVWCEAKKDTATSTPKISQCFNIDKNGVIFKESPLISGSLILTIYDLRNKSDSLHTKIKNIVASTEMINFIIEVKKTLASDSNIKIDNFEIISENDLIVKTNEGWLIYFDSHSSIKEQTESLEAVLSELVKESRKSLEYVDLRINGRVYYK